MRTVKGVYENGTIKLMEKIRFKRSQTVLVTFLEEEKKIDEDQVRNLSLTQPADFLKEYLGDEREDIYQDYAKKIIK